MTSKINALTGSGGVAIDGDASGIIELQSNGTKVAEVSAAGVLSANSGYGSVAPVYGVRAWVSFNGTGTVAIRGSANVSSITDNGTGDYTVNFTTAMPDTNYAATFTPQDGTAGTAMVGGCTHTKAVGSVKCWAAYVSSTQNKTLYDTDDNNVVIMR
jgi:hypothetical protein